MNQVADAALDPAVGGTGAFGASISSADSPQSNPRVLLRAMQVVSAQAKKPRSSSGLTDSPDNGPCAISGSVTVNASANSASITFNNCQDSPGQFLNGTVSATAVSETSTSFTANFHVDLTFTETGSQALRLLGDFSISENCASPGVNCVGTFSGTSLGAAHGNEVWYISSFSITSVDVVGGGIDVTASYRVSSSHLNGSVQVNTSPPIHFAAGASYPESGTINITGANNTSAVITINSSDPNAANAVLIQVETDGNTSSFEFTEDYSWLELEAI